MAIFFNSTYQPGPVILYSTSPYSIQSAQPEQHWGSVLFANCSRDILHFRPPMVVGRCTFEYMSGWKVLWRRPIVYMRQEYIYFQNEPDRVPRVFKSQPEACRLNAGHYACRSISRSVNPLSPQCCYSTIPPSRQGGRTLPQLHHCHSCSFVSVPFPTPPDRSGLRESTPR